MRHLFDTRLKLFGTGMKPLPTGVYFYVPETFDATSFPELRGFENEANWLLNRIACLHNTYRHGPQEYVAISRETMRLFIKPNHVSRVRSALLDHRVIQCDDKFVPAHFDRDGNGKSLGYRLAEPYLGPLKRMECTKRALAAKVRAHRLRYNDKPMAEHELDAVHRYLLNWLRRVRIDIHKAYQQIDLHSSSEAQKVTKLGRRGRKRLVLGYAKSLNRMTAESIYDEEFEFTVCRFGRCHTNVTRLLTEARRCLSVAGSGLVGLDIRNSQLVFFSLLLQESIYDRIGRKETAQGDGSAPAAPSDTPRGNFSNPSLLPPDADRFVRLTNDGRIYDHLMERITPPSPSRKKFKQAFFRDVLYGDDRAYYSRHSPLTTLFRTEFPSVHEFVKEQKKGGYEKLAQKMQGRESRYMISQVCTRLMNHHPEVPVVTIHDSILTTPEHVQTVKRVMDEEFVRLGVSPAIHVENAAEG